MNQPREFQSNNITTHDDNDAWDTISHLGSIETGAVSSSWQIHPFTTSSSGAGASAKLNQLDLDPRKENINDGGPKVSDAITYGPRFCQIFKEYTSTLPVPVNSNRHLMSLCTDHLIPFCKWARETEAQATSIHATLLDHDYLRPEVRNGIVVVLIYTFAAVKALKDSNMDMFRTMEDTESGKEFDPFFCFLLVSSYYLLLPPPLPPHTPQTHTFCSYFRLALHILIALIVTQRRIVII